jgi:hypothetical protein
MRPTVFAIGLAVVSIVTASAMAEETKAKSGGESVAYTGCLAAGDEAGEFKLTHVNGGADEYELLGGKDLKGHVGHKVEIKGSLVPAQAAEHAEEGEEEGENEAAHRHLRVSSMKHIAATCP